jgi:hypothetical protein
MFPVRYELGFDIPGDGIFQSHRRENLKSYEYRLNYVINPRFCFVLEVGEWTITFKLVSKRGNNIIR